MSMADTAWQLLSPGTACLAAKKADAAATMLGEGN
jgi:hypothetical protein